MTELQLVKLGSGRTSADPMVNATCAGCSKRFPRQHVQHISAEFARTVARLAEHQREAA